MKDFYSQLEQSLTNRPLTDKQKEEKQEREASRKRKRLEDQMGITTKIPVDDNLAFHPSHDEEVLEELGRWCAISLARMKSLFMIRGKDHRPDEVNVDKLAIFLLSLAMQDEDGRSTAVLGHDAYNVDAEGYIIDSDARKHIRHIPEPSMELILDATNRVIAIFEEEEHSGTILALIDTLARFLPVDTRLMQPILRD